MDFSPEKKMYQKTLPEKPFDLDQWYPKLSIFTYKSYFLPLTRLEAKVIVDQHSLSKNPINQQPNSSLEALKEKINQFYQSLPKKKYFLRLSTRSPKDVQLNYEDQKQNKYLEKMYEKIENQKLLKDFKSQKNQIQLDQLSDLQANDLMVAHLDCIKEDLKISNCSQILFLLTQSYRVMQDLKQRIAASKYEQKQDEDELVKIILREYVDIKEIEEFRCFYYNHKLTAISQYNIYVYFKSFQDKKIQNQIKQLIQNKFNQINDFLDQPNGVIDFAVNLETDELNPFNTEDNQGTGGAWFTWVGEDLQILQNGPLQLRVTDKLVQNVAEWKYPIFDCTKQIQEALEYSFQQYKKTNNCLIQ